MGHREQGIGGGKKSGSGRGKKGNKSIVAQGWKEGGKK